MNDIFRGTGVEIRLNDSEDFLKIKETLTRIGVASKKTNTLYQSCHILHKRDNDGNSRYSIVHFKEMFKLDGKPSSLEQKDIARRNYVVGLLKEWNLLNIVDESILDETKDQNREIVSTIKVLSHKDKSSWELIAKYKIGKK